MIYNVFIPLAISGEHSQYVNGRARDSIMQQRDYDNKNLKPVITTYATEGEINSQRNITERRLGKLENIPGEAGSRNLCRDAAVSCAEYLCIMQDRDVVHLNVYNYGDMHKYMLDNPLCGAVSIKHTHGCGSVDIGCMMWRVSVLQQISFINVYGTCLCKETCEQITKLGFTVNYLDNLTRIMEV